MNSAHVNSTQKKTDLSFHESVLSIKFRENTVIEVKDIIYIYCYGFEQSNGKAFGILFDSSTKHELSEEAIVHLTESGYLNNIIAIAYISKDLISKIRLSLLLIFERPRVKPKLFDNEQEASEWIRQQVLRQSWSCAKF